MAYTQAASSAGPSRSNPPSIADQSIDFAEYEEPDSATLNNKHLNPNGNSSSSKSRSPQRRASSGSSSVDTVAGSNSGLTSEEDAAHIQTIESAMARLKQLNIGHEADWEKVYTHPRDVTVHVMKSVVNVSGKQKKVPLFRGEKFIQGYMPEQVFEVVGRRSLWDDWYDSGNLVADLNNSTSMTYMNMHVPGTARPRDLSLIERVEASTDGTIWFAATSIETNKVPHVHGRTRAYMALNGWILKPFTQNGQKGTWCFYYLQIDPHGLSPFPLATKMVSKRLVHIYRIEDHLRKHGTPRSAGTGQSPPSNRTTNNTRNRAAVAGAVTNGSSSSNDEAQYEESSSALPPHISLDTSHPSFKTLQQAKQRYEALLQNGGRWDKAVDSAGNPLYTQNEEGSTSSLPIMKGEARMPNGITTEQVLGTLLSPAAKRIWNEYLQCSLLLESVTSLEHTIHRDTYKGIHPHLPSRTYELVQGVTRTDTSSENGNITCISASSGSGESSSDSGLRNSLDYAAWSIAPLDHDTVQLSNAIKIDLNYTERVKTIPDFIKRILIMAYAGTPSKVGQCIKQYGHAPFFLRWAPGKAKLEEEDLDASDFKQGAFVWKISGKGKSTESISGTSEQVAWLQYSSTMYPKGLALRTSDTNIAIKAAKVQGFQNTIQLSFPPQFSSDSIITLEATRHSGNNPAEVQWNGETLNDVITPARGRSLVKKTPNGGGPSALAASNTQRPEQLAERTGNGSTGSKSNNQTASFAGVVNSKQLNQISEKASDLATIHKVPVDTQGRRQLPDDAMLILTRDIYFTRSQMGIIMILLLAVWCAGRYL